MAGRDREAATRRWWRPDRGRGVLALAGATAVVALLGLGPGLASAAGTTPTTTAASGTTSTSTTVAAPTLSLTATSPVLVETRSGSWSTRVVLTTSASCPHVLWFWLVLPSNRVVPASSYAVPAPGAASGGATRTLRNGRSSTTCPVPAFQTTPIAVTFSHRTLAPPATATLVVSQAAPRAAGSGATTAPPGGPTTIVVTTQGYLPWSDLVLWPLVGALVFALAVLVTTAAWLVAKKVPVARPWKTPVYASAAWTFKDSWATNITAVGALIGTFLTASGATASVFPGVPIHRFSLLSAFTGGLVVISPLVIGLFGTTKLAAVTPPKGETVVSSLLALSAAALVTLFGVGAGLAFLGLLIVLSSATATFGGVLLAALSLAALVTALYAVRSTVALCASSQTAAAAVTRVQPEHFTRARLALIDPAGEPPAEAARALDAVMKVDAVASGISPSSSTSLTL